MKVVIGLEGCDDTTAFAIEATSEQVDFLKTIAARSVAVSTYGCMPKLTLDSEWNIQRVEEAEAEALEASCPQN